MANEIKSTEVNEDTTTTTINKVIQETPLVTTKTNGFEKRNNLYIKPIPITEIVTTKEELMQTKVTVIKIVNMNDVPLPILSDDLTSLIQRIRDSKDINSINLINGILEYVEVMKPGNPIDANKGSIYQSRLYRWYLFLFNQPILDWDITFLTVLKIVDEFKDTGAYSMRYINRFISEMSLSSKDIESFININNLLITISNPSTRRDTKKQVDIERSLSHSVSQEGKQKVIQLLNK